MANAQYPSYDHTWLAIAVGNTRIRAAIFQSTKYLATYACNHDEIDQLEQKLSDWLESMIDKVAIASVVPQLITPWHNLPQTQIITTDAIPIPKLYPTMGVDRALNLWGASTIYGCPVLVIDAGTALTISGLDDQGQFAGGAILPGLQMQLHALNLSTAALPLVELSNLVNQLPPRWANNTADAIQSGVIYTVIASLQAFMQDWLQQFPHSKLVITGGDAPTLSQHLSLQMIWDKDLIFWGIQSFLR